MATLAGFGEQKAALFRGVVLQQLLRASQGATDFGLVHLFLLPPDTGSTRFAIYETHQPASMDLPLSKLTRQAITALQDADCDPRVVEGAEPRWRGVDRDRHALYLGTGARIPSLNPMPVV